jgi:Domain of unknown function (DUF1906)
MQAGANSVDAGSVLAALLLFGLLGLLGQGIRAVVGLRNAGALNMTTPTDQSVFSAAYLLVSLMIGFIAGVLAGIALKFQDFTKLDQSSWQQLLGIIASGYVGADFVENTMNLVIPGAQSAQKRAPVVSAPKVAPAIPTTPDLSELNMQISGLTSQVGQIQAALAPPAPRAPLKLSAIDVAQKLGEDPTDYSVEWLKQKGFDTVLRYISSGDQSKSIDANEAEELVEAGITVGIVYELYGGSQGLPGSIDAAHGARDGAYALKTLKALGVPQGVVVYFAVDANVNNNNDINNYVIPYFKAAKQAMGGYYRTGVYGGGSTCAAALDSAGCDKAWLANAKDWNGYAKFLASGRASIVQSLGNKLYDPDTIVDTDWGGFNTLVAAEVA